MTEQVIRHRGSAYDEDGKLIPGTDQPLLAFAVAPAGGSHVVTRARDGRTVQCAVYFFPAVDVVKGDELTVRGERFQTIVNDWRSPTSSRRGLEVLCVRGEG